MWFVFPRLGLPYEHYVLVAESFAVVVEAIYLARFGLRSAFLWSVFANMSSAGLGLLSRHFFGWP